MPDIKNAWTNSSKIAQDKPKPQGQKNRLKIGRYNNLVIESRSDFGLYLSSDEERILLPNKYVPDNFNIGDSLEVFVYTDSEDRLVATTLKPAGIVGDFVFLKAKDVTSFGTFMEWGLEKDLLVPKNEQQDSMSPGKKYLTKICLDNKTQRVYGTTQISVNCDKNIKDLKAGQQVDLIIHSITKIGIMAVINNRYYGMLYLNETYQDLSIGDTCIGYIMRFREDKKIDLTLKKPGYQSVKGSTQKIVKILKKAGGFIPCYDKSSPEDIKKFFSMSKKEFKKAVGGLYKKGVLELKKDGIRLKK
ncbi:MAG: S1-like domain-containing RNA-binding protein [Thermodesulfobacteriota bacterium]